MDEECGGVEDKNSLSRLPTEMRGGGLGSVTGLKVAGDGGGGIKLVGRGTPPV